MKVSSAVEFFDRLSGTVCQLALRPERPLGTSALIGTTKRLLGMGPAKIELRGVLLHEAKLLRDDIRSMCSIWTMGAAPTTDDYCEHIAATRSRAEPVIGALATGCF